MDWKTFRNHAIELGYRLRKDDVERLARFYTLLEDGNQRAALTAITDLSGYLERHVLDALTVSCALNSTEPPRRILDVGAGAGIPAIPLAIALPRHAHYEESPGAPPHIYALESVGKKTAFMESCKVPLGLVDTFSVLDGRA